MQKNGMATAALIFGILSLVLCLFGGMGIFWGVMGITFACLSKLEKMDITAIIGLITSIIGCILSGIMIIIMIVLLQNSEELQNIFEDYYNYYYDMYYATDDDEYFYFDDENRYEGYDSFEEYFYDEYFNNEYFNNEYFNNEYFNNESLYYNNGGHQL